MKSALQVYTSTGQKISLNDSHFKAKGGEGLVYIKGKIAYKIGSPIPDGKISELSVLSSNRQIAAPYSGIYDKNKKLIGISMDAVNKDYVWAELFTSNFKNLRKLDLSDLSEQLFNIGHAAHAENFLIVDANELNFIVDKGGIVVAIDVNSWQTKSYPPTALMQSVKDFRSPNKYSEDTDWYSLAVIDFQKWTNMHPYKGRHDKYKGTIIECIEKRRKDLVSVFNSGVRCPQSMLSVDDIPPGLRSWFFNIFEKGKSGPPPNSFEKASLPIHQKIIGGKLKISSYIKIKDEPTYNPNYNFDFVVGKYMVMDNSIYRMSLFNNNTMTTKITSIVNPQVSNNVIYQNLFGKFSFFVNEKLFECKKIDNAKVISAKQQGDALAVCVFNNQNYELYVYYKEKLVYKLSDISIIETNFLCLDRGLIILKNGSDLHCVYMSKAKELLDVNIPADAILTSVGDTPLFIKDNKYYTFSEN